MSFHPKVGKYSHQIGSSISKMTYIVLSPQIKQMISPSAEDERCQSGYNSFTNRITKPTKIGVIKRGYSEERFRSSFL